ncbi:MAG: AI-2E family transporter, partial [Candidatus Eremiobacteraeota bacterium]|nr:AI-2E family transporter [Candidatus Eremiobacteraeota bacterium]
VQVWLHTRFRAQVLPPQFADIEGRVLAQVSALLNAAVQSIGNIVLSIANVLLIGVTAVMLSFYMLTHVDEIRASFYSLFPARAQSSAHHFTREVARVVGGFMLGQIVLCAYSGVATFAVLLLIRSQYALLLGVITGLLYAVPYLGVLVAVLIGFALGLLVTWKVAVLTAVLIFLVTRVADYVLVPKVMGESVGISPIAIIFAVFAGGELFGLWGLVLAIPVAALFKVVWNLWLHPWLTGKPVDNPAVTYAEGPSPRAAAAPMPTPSSSSSTAKAARS